MGIKAMVGGLLAAAAAATAGYWYYYSPMLAMQTMRDAAQARHAESFNRHVDYPKLRESLKGQMAARVAEQLGHNGGHGVELSNVV
jgi:23S rRNA A2030 N6-methylase RlmJ